MRDKGGEYEVWSNGTSSGGGFLFAVFSAFCWESQVCKVRDCAEKKNISSSLRAFIKARCHNHPLRSGQQQKHGGKKFSRHFFLVGICVRWRIVAFVEKGGTNRHFRMFFEGRFRLFRHSRRFRIFIKAINPLKCPLLLHTVDKKILYGIFNT